MAPPHPDAVPSTDATAGLPRSVTATHPQVAEAYPSSPVDHGEPPRSWRGLVLAGCALLGIVIGVTGQHLTAGSPTAAAPPPPTASASATPVRFEIVPVSASGTNFKPPKNDVWESQRYATQQFGGLKKGIGLRLDLGSARPLTAVTFSAVNGPLTVELRAGDSEASDGAAYALVGSAVQATGATSLPATSGGSHRYWMIWVTGLAPDLQAKISKPAAQG